MGNQLGKEETVCHKAHETSCWSKLVVKKEETTVPVCSVVWEELCKAAAALSENYSPHQVSNSPPGSSYNNVGVWRLFTNCSALSKLAAEDMLACVGQV